jgi:hypothetical protein
VEAFDAPGGHPPASLPASAREAAPAARPLMVRGGEPGAVVLLVEIDVQGVGEAA